MPDEPSGAGPRRPEPSPALANLPEGEASVASTVREDLRALRAVVEGTARGTGQEFFQSLVRHLAEAINVPYAVIAEFPKAPPHVRTLAFWARDRIADNFEYDFTGTPCAEILSGGLVHHPTGVSQRFPGATPLVKLGIDSYMGVPFLDAEGNILGHLAVFDERPMPAEPRRLFIFRIFAARATAERERMRAEKRLQESERRYRDLYDHAPHAYVSIGTDRRLRSANIRASELLGHPIDELVGANVASFLADTPEGQERGAEIYHKFLAGEEVCGQRVEMRRQDGSPLWVNVWMKPLRGPDGQVQASRSIWVDITAQVLAEQERARLQQQNLYLQEEIKADHNFEQIVGHSAALGEVLNQIRRVAPTDASVLITGATGTGKELIARAIHSTSRRKDMPLIKVNCAALPAGLVESELFGHEKGAFSGAIARRLGRFELADAGTLFLDEVGELPPEAQAKLLRVLQEREFDRVGGGTPITVDVRVIAATNRDLFKAVQEKTFREDLYYRLNVFPIRLPPLRERTEDIPLLIHFLVNKFSARIGKRIESVSRPTMQRLVNYPWPGNIRELENVLERAVILATGSALEIGPDLLPVFHPAPTPALTPDREPSPPPAVPQPAEGQPAPSLEDVERDYIVAVLRQTRWVIHGPRGAAQVLGLHPNTLRNRMKRLRIKRPS